MKHIIRLFFIWMICTAAADADTKDCQIIKIIDGDTVKILRDDHNMETVRLKYIDAPELAQRGGKDSMKALEAILGLSEAVFLEEHGKDKYRRTLGCLKSVRVSKETGLVTVWDVSELMVGLGYAWSYHAPSRFRNLEKHARDLDMGIWAEEDPKPPWQFRKEQKKHGH